MPPEETGIAFTNTLSELASAENRILNNGSGVAAGDFDNDGWADLFFCSLNHRNTLFRNLGGWRFEDVTETAGLKFKPGFYRGAVFADVNGDGWLDLLVATAADGVLCFINDGHGKFTDQTAAAGTGGQYAPSTLALADVDGNGTLDLYVSNLRKDDIRDAARVPVMYVNGKPTVPPQLRDRLVFFNGQLLEFGEADMLYLNDGRGHFQGASWTGGRFLTEQGQPLAEPPRDWGLTAAFRDLNDDGAPDLYVCNDFWTPDRIWLNTGDGRFRLIDRLSVRKTSASSMGVDFADINRDGHVDFFVADMLGRSPESRKRQHLSQPNLPTRIGEISNRPQAARNTLFLNQGDGTFAEIANLAGVAASDWSWSPVFLDVDLDGYEDLLITTGHLRDIQDLDATQKIQSMQEAWRRSANPASLDKAFIEAKREHMKLYPHLDTPIAAFRNLGNLRFEEMTEAWGLSSAGVQHGIALADLDNDGDVDVVVNRLGAAAGVFRNDTTAPRVAVRLHGKPPNTQAIGAKIELLGGAVPSQKQEVVAGGSYLSGSDPLRVFAAGDAQQGMTLRVSWRDRSVTEVTGVGPDRLYEIFEESAQHTPATAPKSQTDAAPYFRDVTDRLRHIHHEDDFNDFARQPLLPRKLSQSGPGVAWFDLNQDGWDDLIIGSGKGGQLAVYLNQKGKAFIRFNTPALDAVAARDQTTPLGWHKDAAQTAILLGSASYEDGDANASCAVIYDHTSRKIENAFPGHTASVGALALADIDGDGDLDLFVGGQVIPGKYPAAADSLLFRQSEDKWVLDETVSRTLRGVGLVNGAVWSNLDGDGFPELILACEWGRVRVFHNDSGKALREVTRDWGFEQFTGLWTGVTTGDLDGDGKLDIIAGNWGLNSSYKATPQQPLHLYYGSLRGAETLDILETEFDPIRNQSTPSARRDALFAALPFMSERFPTYAAYSQATISDVLRDRPDAMKPWAVTTLASTVFFNRGAKFEAKALPIEAQFAPAFSVNVGDVDGDGNEDVFLSQNFFAFRTEEPRLDAGRGLWLRGDGRGNLTAMPGQLSGISIYGEQRGAALADFDKDGRVDLVVTQNGAATKLYQNVRARPGLRVRLAGPSGNPDGIGAVVRLRFGERWGPAREVHAGSGYWSQDGAIPVLGTPEMPTSVWVRWPGGQTNEQTLQPNAREITVSQSSAKALQAK